MPGLDRVVLVGVLELTPTKPKSGRQGSHAQGSHAKALDVGIRDGDLRLKKISCPLEERGAGEKKLKFAFL